jgi:predicted molibdopterin-dependent oxidoreductase YjgC
MFSGKPLDFTKQGWQNPELCMVTLIKGRFGWQFISSDKQV